VRGPGADGRRRASRVWEVTAVMGAVTELGRELARDGIEMVTLEATGVIWRSNKLLPYFGRSGPSRTRP